jgi:hypothetical protein
MKNAIAKFIPQNFNDFLCLFLMGAIVTLWVLDGFKLLSFQLNSEVMTATIIFFTLIGQFYFRKKQDEAG